MLLIGSSVWLGTQYLAQASLAVVRILLPQPPALGLQMCYRGHCAPPQHRNVISNFKTTVVK